MIRFNIKATEEDFKCLYGAKTGNFEYILETKIIDDPTHIENLLINYKSCDTHLKALIKYQIIPEDLLIKYYKDFSVNIWSDAIIVYQKLSQDLIEKIIYDRRIYDRSIIKILQFQELDEDFLNKITIDNQVIMKFFPNIISTSPQKYSYDFIKKHINISEESYKNLKEYKRFLDDNKRKSFIEKVKENGRLNFDCYDDYFIGFLLSNCIGNLKFEIIPGKIIKSTSTNKFRIVDYKTIYGLWKFSNVFKRQSTDLFPIIKIKYEDLSEFGVTNVAQLIGIVDCYSRKIYKL